LQVQTTEVMLASRSKRTYSNAHTYHINSISVNSDQETFLSADDLRINLWNLEVTNQSFNIVDIKPTNMEDLTEVCWGAAAGVCWGAGAGRANTAGGAVASQMDRESTAPGAQRTNPAKVSHTWQAVCMAGRMRCMA
jgi:hypothetical protein